MSGAVPDDFDRGILNATAHRPWPMPDRPWVMTQTWNDLLFAHWPVEPRVLRPKVPAEFALDLFDGAAWIGVVPFRMSNVGPRGVPALPGLSAFPELNVRTYVQVNDKPGVYFFSLDASSAMAVWTARALFNLPYYRASMTLTRLDTRIEYQSRRSPNGHTAELIATYGPVGEAFEPVPGSLEYFLTERYCLYNRHRTGAPYRLEIHHSPWRLQPAYAELTRNSLADASGLALPSESPRVHFAERQDVVTWMPAALRPSNA
jgi:uncharacterized protein